MTEIVLINPERTIVYGTRFDCATWHDASVKLIHEAGQFPDGRRPGYINGVDPGGFVRTEYAEMLLDGEWRELAPAGAQPGGDVGGDRQFGDAWHRRWVLRRPQGNWAVYGEYYYVSLSDPDDDLSERVIDRCREYLIVNDLHDMDGSEAFADLRYDWMVRSDCTDEVAKELLDSVSVDDVRWTGAPFYHQQIPER